MESLETSCDRGLEFNLKLEEISPEKDRALQTKYHKLMQKFISENEEIYTENGYIINEEKERMYRNNEKIELEFQDSGIKKTIELFNIIISH